MTTRTQLIAVGALTVAFGVAFAWWRWEQSAEIDRGPAVVFGVLADEEHRVTTEMDEASRAMAERPAPAFRAEAHDGEDVDSAALVGDRPVVLVFIKDGCPCSTSAEPFFARLHAAFGADATFLGVIDGDRSIARRWVDDHGTPYRVLADPDLDLVRAFGARNSAYVALVDRDGTIARLWPGYSEGILREIAAELASRTGRPEADVGADEAPDLPYSGCPYPIEPA